MTTDSLTEPYVLRADSAGVCTLTLNRPASINGLSLPMIDALQAALDQVADDSSVQVLVLAGAGKHFCAGHDLREIDANRNEEWLATLFSRCNAMMQTLLRLPQPVIARVHGVATAAGCQLVAACDLAVASEQARFALPGVNIGLFCSTPAVAVGRNVARKRVMEMLLTGDMIDAETALEWGLVNRVVPPADLDSAVSELVAKIKSKSAVAIRLGKQLFYQQIEQRLDTAYDLAGAGMSCNVQTADAAEGIAAFLEKRAPNWPGSAS